MSFKLWLETYSRENSWLKQYLKEKPLDLANHYHHFIRWQGSAAVLNRVGLNKQKIEKEHDEMSDEFYDAADKIEKAMTAKEIENFLHAMNHTDYTDAPSWSFMDYKRIVPRNTWLIHFSDDASDIHWKGFQYGIDDPTKLAYTTHYSKNAKKYGGYNFAFIADSRETKNAANTQKYGQHAVMFQSSGVLAYHYGDEENQVIFWSKGVNPGSLVYLHNEDGKWCVQPINNDKRECLYSGDLSDAISWVENNHQQYRKSLFSLPPKGWYAKYANQ